MAHRNHSPLVSQRKVGNILQFNFIRIISLPQTGWMRGREEMNTIYMFTLLPICHHLADFNSQISHAAEELQELRSTDSEIQIQLKKTEM